MIDATVQATLRGLTGHERVAFGAALWGCAPALGRLVEGQDPDDAVRRLESLGLAIIGASTGLFGKGKPIPTDLDELEHAVFAVLSPELAADVAGLREEPA